MKKLIVGTAFLFLFMNVAEAEVTKEVPPKVESEKKYPFWDNVSGAAAITSNYIFRGISQTQNLPAFQAGLNYDLPWGFYLNFWGSNVKFAGTDATLEADPTFGYHKDFNDDFNLDLSFQRYSYPSASQLNYNELIGIINYKFFQGTLGYSGNVYNVHKSGTYYNGGINYTIPEKYFHIEDISLQALIGHYTLPSGAGKSYNDFLISFTKKIKIYEITVQWTDTNHHNPPYDGSVILAAIAANF